MPKNASTNRTYSGINVLILWGAVIQHGFSGQNWLTFRQALALGGHVRKSERGTTVVYADRFVPDDAKQRAAESGGEARAIPFLKRFTVFNTDQCDGLTEGLATVSPPPPPGTIEPRVEALIKATGIDVRIGGNRAFYDASEWPLIAAQPRSLRFLRLAQVCLRGAGRRVSGARPTIPEAMKGFAWRSAAGATAPRSRFAVS
jgi:antirestriction protein ArdC